MSEYKEFWIDNSNETNKDFFLYNVKRGVMNYNFQGAIHVIEYSAYEQANKRIKELESYIENILIPTNKQTIVYIKEPINEHHVLNLRDSFSENDKLRDKNKSLQAQVDVMRASLERIASIESLALRTKDLVYDADEALAKAAEIRGEG